MIYESLLEGRSILKPMLKWVSKKQHPLNLEIVKFYQIILQDMNEKTLQIIGRNKLCIGRFQHKEESTQSSKADQSICVFDMHFED